LCIIARKLVPQPKAVNLLTKHEPRSADQPSRTHGI